jgi:hypothetical protein
VTTSLGRAGRGPLAFRSGRVLLFVTIGLIVTGTALLALGTAGHARPLVFGSLLCISLAVVPLMLLYASGRPNVGSGTVREAAGVTIDPLVTPRPGDPRPAMASDEGALPSPWPHANVGSQIAFSFNYSNSAFPVNRAGDDMWGTAGQFKVARAARVKMRYASNANISDGSGNFPNASLKLARHGNRFTTSTSPECSGENGAGSAPMAMTDDSVIGLFVTSHNLGLLGCAALTNVPVGTR